MTTTTQPAHSGPHPRHVSLVALPDAVVSTLFGIVELGGVSGEPNNHAA